MPVTCSQELESELSNVLEVTNQEGELSPEERNSIEDSLKAVLTLKRRKISEIESTSRRERGNQQQSSTVLHATYLKQLKKDLFCFCMGVVELIDTNILPKIQSAQGRVFFLKVKGDFFRYSAECLRKGDHSYDVILREGLKAYKKAYEIASAELSCEDLIRLNLCLNFSVFYYVVARDPMKAIALVSKTLSQLNEEKDTILDEIWKSIQPTMCLLKNNLMLWLSEVKEDN